MKKPASKIRADIARLQEQLKIAETREAERIGRLALKAGLGEIEIDDAKLIAALEEIARRFRGGGNQQRKTTSAQDTTGAASGQSSEA